MTTSIYNGTGKTLKFYHSKDVYLKDVYHPYPGAQPYLVLNAQTMLKAEHSYLPNRNIILPDIECSLWEIGLDSKNSIQWIDIPTCSADNYIISPLPDGYDYWIVNPDYAKIVLEHAMKYDSSHFRPRLDKILTVLQNVIDPDPQCTAVVELFRY